MSSDFIKLFCIMFRLSLFKVFILSFFISLFFSFNVYALENLDIKRWDNFSVSPVKIELFANPGDRLVRELTLSNNTKSKLGFSVEVKDFKGSDDFDNPVVIIDDEHEQSLRKYVKPKFNSFVLDSGEKLKLPIELFIPEFTPSKGFYFTVLVSAYPIKDYSRGANTISRVGSLFFVRVGGDVLEDASLLDFRMIEDKKVFFNPINSLSFEFLFENKGNVHLNPYGNFYIKNTLGEIVAYLDIDPYFSLPGYLRYRDVSWNNNNDSLFGRYEAVLELNRGYGDYVDIKTVSFWVLPIKYIVSAFVLFVLLFFVIWKFKKKKKNEIKF